MMFPLSDLGRFGNERAFKSVLRCKRLAGASKKNEILLIS